MASRLRACAEHKLVLADVEPTRVSPEDLVARGAGGEPFAGVGIEVDSVSKRLDIERVFSLFRFRHIVQHHEDQVDLVRTVHGDRLLSVTAVPQIVNSVL